VVGSGWLVFGMQALSKKKTARLVKSNRFIPSPYFLYLMDEFNTAEVPFLL